jgi:hypothetical protein
MRNALVANVLPVARLIRTLIDGDRRASSVVGTREGFLPSVASVSLTVDARRRRVCTRGGFTGLSERGYQFRPGRLCSSL